MLIETQPVQRASQNNGNDVLSSIIQRDCWLMDVDKQHPDPVTMQVSILPPVNFHTGHAVQHMRKLSTHHPDVPSIRPCIDFSRTENPAMQQWGEDTKHCEMCAQPAGCLLKRLHQIQQPSKDKINLSSTCHAPI